MNYLHFDQLSTFSITINQEFPAKKTTNSIHPALWNSVKKATAKAKQIFDQINADSTECTQAKVDLYQNLYQNLQRVKSSVNSSKTLWQRITSLFIYLSQEEAGLHSIMNEVRKAKRKENKLEKELWRPQGFENFPFVLKTIQTVLSFAGVDFPITKPEWEKLIEKQNAANLQKAPGKLREAYARLIGNKLLPSNLEGSLRDSSLQSVRSELNDFVKLFRPLFDEETILQFRKINEKLVFAEKTALDLAFINRVKLKPKFHSPEDRKKHYQMILADCSYEIQSKLHHLPIGEEIIIPGGYTSESNVEDKYAIIGHAVLYSIRRQENGKYTFTLINTGEGSGALSGLVSILRGLFSGKFCDYVIEDLDLDQLQSSFFIQLLEQQISEKDHSIEKLFKIIIDHLLDGDVKKIKEGREHGIQTNGTCTHESIFSWLESVLSPEIFHCFNLYTHGTGLHRLQSLKKEELASHEITQFAGVWEKRTLTGKDLVLTIREIGERHFVEHKNHLPRFLAPIKSAFNEAIAKQQELRSKKKDALWNLDKNALAERCKELRKESAKLKTELEAEEEQKNKDWQNTSYLGRIGKIISSTISPTSTLSRQFADNEKRIITLENHLAQLNDPQFHSLLQQRLANIDKEIIENTKEQESLSRKQKRIEALQMVPQKITKHFELEILA